MTTPKRWACNVSRTSTEDTSRCQHAIYKRRSVYHEDETFFYWWCGDCKAVLPFANARLDGEHAAAIAQEIAAVVLADTARDARTAHLLERGLDASDAGWGWYMHGAGGDDRIFRKGHHRREGALAGWLAREIWTARGAS